jgi:predicted RNA-binding Zn-ribbon protein involved in translation (DUF1610 family)
MKVEEIEIHVGEPSFPFESVRQLEAKCEAATAFSSAPTMEEVNGKLRQMAASLGANAVVHVEYSSGMSMTSWRSMKGTGLAVRRLAEEFPCPTCAETIKRAATKCRFCGVDLPESAHLALASSTAPVPSSAAMMEPLRSTNNPQWWILVAIGLFALLMFLGM